MGKLFLNPYVTILQIDNTICVKSYKEYSFGIHKREAFQYLLSKSEFNENELEMYFSITEIASLKESRLLLANRNLVPETTGMLSRQRGLFSIISSDYRFFENKIRSMRILILGAGAIGTHILWNLVTLGVQNITIVDFDLVEESNLNRQLFYGFDDIGCKKVEALTKKLHVSYPDVNFSFVDLKIESEKVLADITEHDFVFKAFDAPKEGTEWVNAVCVKKKIPYISGGFLNEVGIVGPVYVPNKTHCYECNTHHDGCRYNTYSPTFSPVVINVVSKMMLVFLNIVLGKFDDLSQYYAFNLHTGLWKELNYETKEKCHTCGKEASYDILQLKNIIKYLLIAITDFAVAFVANSTGLYILSYLFIIVLTFLFFDQIKNAGFILNCSTLIVTINTASYLIAGNVSLFSSDYGLIGYIQELSLILMTICITITVVSFLWYKFGGMLVKCERKLKNVNSSRYNKKI